MAYKSLTLDPKTPPLVTSLIRSLENHFFSDVHTMLRLPQRDRGLTAGCNFAVAQVLAAVVSGVSVTLYSQQGGSGARFKGLVTDFYPWASEPNNAVRPLDGADIIYSVIRNPLTHDLGLDLEQKRKTQKVLIKRLAVAGGDGLSEQAIEQLETDPSKITPSPTITITSAETVLLVEMFYAGVRRMIENLSSDSARMQAAENFLASI